MSQLDLLLLCPVSTVGGAERVVFQVARGAKRAGCSVQALFREPIDRHEMAAWYAEADIQCRTTPFLKPHSPTRLISSMLALRGEIRALGPKVVNLHNAGNTILATDVLALRMAGIRRIVCSLHHPLDPATIPRSWKLSTRQAARWASQIVVTTPALQKTVEAMGVPAGVMTNIALGVEPLPRILTRDQARTELRIPFSAFVVGTLGRMEPYKRMDEVIRACAQIPACFLLLAGGGPEEASLQLLASELLPSRHMFLGRIKDLSAFYYSLNVFALLSDLEGFGLVYAEAGLAGVPSIGCDAGGVRYAIQDGKTGFLINVASPSDIVPILTKLVGDPQLAATMGAEAKRFSESGLSMERFEAEYLKVLFAGTSL